MPQVNITVDISKTLYLRDPLETTLGKKIIYHAILLFDDIGFEEFNFKKLAISMSSTEASVYRYFENKYMLLVYLVSWYWDYIHFMILLDTRNIKDPHEKLKIMISTLVNYSSATTVPDYIDIIKLHRIVVENASKVYHNKRVDALNEVGLFINLKKLVKTISSVITEIDDNFSYPNSLATNLIELAINNEYYMEHIPNLTDGVAHHTETDPRQETIQMLNYMVDRLM